MSLNPKMFINELRTTTSSTDSSKPSSWRSWGSVMKRKDSSMLYKLYNYYGTTTHDWVLISNLLENNKILPLPRSVICTCVRITMLCQPRLRIKRSESILQLKQLLLSGCTWDPCQCLLNRVPTRISLVLQMIRDRSVAVLAVVHQSFMKGARWLASKLTSQLGNIAKIHTGLSLRFQVAE